MSARTYRGQVRRLAREIRKAEKCTLCGTAVLRGALLDYRGQKMCSLCAVKLVRGRDFLEERRLETA
jgi:CRISPR/Cas system-associated protein Cas10 (large subunit of type III CRISPR-Cas system)